MNESHLRRMQKNASLNPIFRIFPGGDSERLCLIGDVQRKINPLEGNKMVAITCDAFCRWNWEKVYLSDRENAERKSLQQSLTRDGVEECSRLFWGIPHVTLSPVNETLTAAIWFEQMCVAMLKCIPAPRRSNRVNIGPTFFMQYINTNLERLFD